MKIEIPDIDQKALVEDCITNMDASTKKNRLLEHKDDIVDFAFRYAEAASNGLLYKEKQFGEKIGDLTKRDMKFLYNSRLVKATKGRPYYDKILASAPYGICPLCGYREADTLDHYLPESVYFQYSVTVENLIPACIKCNKNKDAFVARQREEETIHPYYDEFDDEVWLMAEINKDAGEPFGFSFRVIRPAAWSKEKYERAKRHMEVFKLYPLYRVLAASEINTEIKRIEYFYKITKSIKAVKEMIREESSIEREKRKNSWKAAIIGFGTCSFQIQLVN